MNKTVVISSNNNDDYLFFIPLVVWSWNKIGWNVIYVAPDAAEKSDLIEYVVNKNCSGDNLSIPFPEIKGYRSETIAQCSRFYVANIDEVYGDTILMTSDSDMMPLSDYWKVDGARIKAYGRNLSDRHYPVCYISMTANRWKEVMNLSGKFLDDIKRDLDLMPNAKSANWNEYWQCDQDLLTRILIPYQNEIIHIDRAISPITGYPIGRIDRSAWYKSLLQSTRIDAHLIRPGYTNPNWDLLLSLIKDIFKPSEAEILWIENYKKEYCKLL